MDEVFKKQLEIFGTESIRFIKGDVEKKLNEERHQSIVTVFRDLMSHAEGRGCVYFLLDICNVFTSPFSPGKPDVSNFLSGAQAIGHVLLEYVFLANPEKFYVMISEEAKRKENIIPPPTPNS